MKFHKFLALIMVSAIALVPVNTVFSAIVPSKLPLLTEDFVFENGAEAADNTNLEGLETGWPIGIGWSSVSHGADAYRSSWQGGPNAKVYNSNTNPARQKMEYGDLKTSGLYASTTYSSAGVSFPIRTMEFQERNSKEPVMKDYLGFDKDTWPAWVGGINGTTLWFSDLMRSETGDTSEASYTAITTGHTPSSECFGIGYFKNTTEDGVKYWGVKYKKGDGSFGYLKTALPVTADETVFAVAKFDFQRGADKVTVWINPDKSSIGEAAPTGGYMLIVDFDPTALLGVNAVGLYHENEKYNFAFSDIRFGNCYEAVSPLGFSGSENGNLIDYSSENPPLETTVSSNSSLNEDDENALADKDNTSGWTSNEANSWIQYKLNNEYIIKRLEFFGTSIPNAKIQTGNGTDWNDIYTGALSDEKILIPDTVLSRRSEERRVGKECRSRWSPYH